MENFKNNKLFKTLEDYKIGKIYYIAPIKDVQIGFDYFNSGKIKGFKWNKSCTQLTSTVHDSSNYKVNFFLENKSLYYACDCHLGTSGCLHVVSSLLTIKGILSPHLLKPPKYKPENWENLRQMLLHEATTEKTKNQKKDKQTGSGEKKTISISIEPHAYSGDFFIVNVFKNSKKIFPYGKSTPIDLNYLIEASFSGGLSESKLIAALNNLKGSYPIILNIIAEDVNFFWTKDLSIQGKTTLNVSGTTVTVEKSCYKDNLPSSDLIFIGDRIVVDKVQKKIGYVSDMHGWALWETMKNFLFLNEYKDGGKKIQIPFEIFNNMQLCFNENFLDTFKSSVSFLVNDKTITPDITTPAYRISISQDSNKKEQSFLKVESLISDSKVATPPMRNLFDILLSFKKNLRGPLTVKKRRRQIIETMLAILSSPDRDEAEKQIVKILEDPDFSNPVFTDKITSLLKNFVNFFYTAYTRVITNSGRWYLISVDQKKEALMYSILYKIFGWEIIDNMDAFDSFIISSPLLYEFLDTLRSTLNESAIELYYQNKPVISSDWEFSLDAREKTGIDWFEIKPEIKCNGRVLSFDEVMKIMKTPQINKHDGTVLTLSPKARDILENLSGIVNKNKNKNNHEIVGLSRLQILDWIEMRKNGVKLLLSREDEDVIERLYRFDKIERKELPKGLQTQLRDYQKEGYYWLSFLYEHRFGACLADDMGLGKTVQAITFLAGIKEKIVSQSTDVVEFPHLIVVPPSLIFNWQCEIEKFFPDFKILDYTGRDRKLNADFDIILTTYDIIRRDIDLFSTKKFHVIIFDEAQAIKNIFAGRTAAVRQLHGLFKLTMTGTPIENHLGEYYSILDLAIPGLLEDYDLFQKETTGKAQGRYIKLINKTHPFVMRRTKEKILKELPPKVESDIFLNLTEQQKILYQKTVDLVKQQIDDAYKSRSKGQAKIIALTAILRLRQICVHPAIIDPSYSEPSPKITYLTEKLKELRDEGHSVLVFSQFTSFLDLLENDLKKDEINYIRMDGKTPFKKRKQLIEKFQQSTKANPIAFIMSLKTGGVGLNLTHASYVFHLDPWWNPAVENQASDRAHRIGQKNTVFITRILMHHSIEEKMIALKKKKEALYNEIMNQDVTSKSSGVITKDDFDFLLN